MANIVVIPPWPISLISLFPPPRDSVYLKVWQMFLFLKSVIIFQDDWEHSHKWCKTHKLTLCFLQLQQQLETKRTNQKFVRRAVQTLFPTLVPFWTVYSAKLSCALENQILGLFKEFKDKHEHFKINSQPHWSMNVNYILNIHTMH